MHELLRFLNCYGPTKLLLSVTLFLEMISAGFSILLPEILRRGIAAIENMNWYELKSIGALSCIYIVLSLFCSISSKLCKRRFCNASEEQLQISLMEKLFQIRRHQLDKWNSGVVVSTVINNAIDGVQESFAAIIALVASASSLSIGSVFMMTMQWQIAAMIIAYTVLIRFLFSKLELYMRRNAATVVEIMRNNNSFLLKLLSNMVLIIVYRKSHFFSEKLADAEYNGLRATMRKSLLTNGMTDITWSLVKVAECIIIYGIGGWLVLKNTTQLGTLISFVFAMDIFVKGLETFASYLTHKATAIGNIYAINQFFNTDVIEDEPSIPISSKQFAIHFDGVSFSYDKSIILDNVSFVINAREKVLLRGTNGGGKSTILKLLSGLYRPTNGVIRFDDQCTSDVHLGELFKVIGVIAQENYVFPVSLEENIALDTSYDFQKMSTILDLLGFNPAINGHTTNLSLGEKQRVNIGRTLYRDDKLLILGDEIFSNIDKANASRILRNLKEEWKEKTVILIAHENIDFPFNRYLRIENGKIIEENAPCETL